MHPNERLIHTFYSAFQQKDPAPMQTAYAEDAQFSDEVFTRLSAAEARAMWEMLISRGKDLELTFGEVSADDQKGSARWTATYTFSQTGRKVTNHIRAEFEFDASGKIRRHRDTFDFYAWARQALGTSGLLLGWTSFLRKKVQDTARKSLVRYMEKRA